MSNRRLLVTGGAGYLGQAVVRAAHDWTVSYTYFRRVPPTDLPGHGVELDLRDAQSVLMTLRELKPQAVIHTAVSNSPPQDVQGIAAATKAVALAAADVGARLIHVSSDAVLDGQGAPYPDDALRAPLTPYGWAKADAEEHVSRLHPSAWIVRTSLIFGLNPIDKHTRWLVDDVVAGKSVRLFTDEICCPIWVDNLAAALVELAEIPPSGHLNVAGSEPINRWDFGLSVLDALGVSIGDHVQPALVAEAYPLRPKDRTLDIRRATELLQTPLLGVHEALKQMAAAERRPSS